MELKALQEKLRAFAAERDWQQFHTPKNLAMALLVEAAELAEIFQWLTPEQSRAAQDDKVLQGRIGEEVADVLLYLLQLADHTSVDVQRAVADKMVKNAKKHPPILPAFMPAPVADRQAQTHVLVDWENVQPRETDIRTLVPDVSDVWIFHGPNQKRVGTDQASFGDNLTLVPISRAGKNALDFHLSFYMGYITARHPEARFVVISNDQGYGPMLEHATELGFAVNQVRFASQKAPTKKTIPIKTTAKKAAPAKKGAQPPAKVPQAKAAPPQKPRATQKASKATGSKKATPVARAQAAAKPEKTKAPPSKAAAAKAPAVKAKPRPQTPVVITKQNEKDADKAYAHVVASLRKSTNKPTRKARLHGAVKSLLNGGKADAAEVQSVVDRLASDGHLAIDDKGAVVMTP